jgi:hypothetical protein
VTESAKDYGIGIEWLHPWNDAAGLTVSELLLMKMTTLWKEMTGLDAIYGVFQAWFSWIQ